MSGQKNIIRFFSNELPKIKRITGNRAGLNQNYDDSHLISALRQKSLQQSSIRHTQPNK